MSFILGLGKDIPLTVIEEMKLYLESIWNKRVGRLGNENGEGGIINVNFGV